MIHVLRAGADRTGDLGVLTSHAERQAERGLARALSMKISAGAAVSVAFNGASGDMLRRQQYFPSRVSG